MHPQLMRQIVLEIFDRYSTLLSYLSGAQRRIGFYRFHQEGFYTGDFLSHKVHYNPHIHTAHAFLSLVQALALPTFLSSAADQARIWCLLQAGHAPLDHTKQLVIVNANASAWLSIRKWPLRHYSALVQRLLADEGLYVVLTGAASERADAAAICQAVQHERLLHMAGKTSLTDLLHLFNLGAVLITNDSGPAHFAALTSIHTVVFFGPETPTVYRVVREVLAQRRSHGWQTAALPAPATSSHINLPPQRGEGV